MDVIVGFGPIHDRLIAAALCGSGLRAEAAAPPTADALALGRTLMARGHPCSTYYLAGAMALHARAHGAGEGICFVTPGDRCGGYGTDLQRALAAAGARGAAVRAISPERASDAFDETFGAASARAAELLVEAVGAGDALVTAAAHLRTRGRDEGAVHAHIAAATHRAARALASGQRACAALRAHRTTLRERAARRPPRARVRVTGELLPTVYDDAGAGLVRWMESCGVDVAVPSLSEWVLYGAWRHGLGAARTHALRDALHEAQRRNVDALGAHPPTPLDPTAWVDAAGAWIPVSLCAGSGFLEIATYLAADHAGSADLVLSLKPFASITSSAASDAVLYALSRQRRTAFLALELNGDLSVQLQSRVELALQRAAPEVLP